VSTPPPVALPQASRELLKDGTFFRRKKELREEQLNEIEVSRNRWLRLVSCRVGDQPADLLRWTCG
jgi:hypothetical protein